MNPYTFRDLTPTELIERLRSAGVPAETLEVMERDLEEDAPEFRHSCVSCGRYSTSILGIEHEGELVYSAPSHMVYCYRDWKPHGLCADCFRAGSLDGFTATEIEYFRENFSNQPTKPKQEAQQGADGDAEEAV